MIEGISHITLVVKDLEKTSKLMKELFLTKEVYSSEDKTFSISKEKFFLINDIWLCIMEGSSLTDCSYNHIAFKIAEVDYEKYLTKIKDLELEILPARSRVQGEGLSIYFYDYDNHLFELHTATLKERLATYERY